MLGMAMLYFLCLSLVVGVFWKFIDMFLLKEDLMYDDYIREYHKILYGPHYYDEMDAAEERRQKRKEAKKQRTNSLKMARNKQHVIPMIARSKSLGCSPKLCTNQINRHHLHLKTFVPPSPIFLNVSRY